MSARMWERAFSGGARINFASSALSGIGKGCTGKGMLIMVGTAAVGALAFSCINCCRMYSGLKSEAQEKSNEVEELKVQRDASVSFAVHMGDQLAAAKSKAAKADDEACTMASQIVNLEITMAETQQESAKIKAELVAACAELRTMADNMQYMEAATQAGESELARLQQTIDHMAAEKEKKEAELAEWYSSRQRRTDNFLRGWRTTQPYNFEYF